MSVAVLRVFRTCAFLLPVVTLTVLSACGDEDDGTTAAEDQVTSTTEASGERTISGEITYGGAALDGHKIVIAVNRQGDNGPPAYSAILTGMGPYTIENVADGSYTILAFIDLGDDMGAPEPDEPSGTYDASGDGTPDVIVVADGTSVTSVDIALTDPA